MISVIFPAVRIGLSSDVYEVMESSGFVTVQVVKNGSNDIAVSVLLNTTAGTALGKYTRYTDREMNSTINTLRCYMFYIPFSWW